MGWGLRSFFFGPPPLEKRPPHGWPIQESLAARIGSSSSSSSGLFPIRKVGQCAQSLVYMQCSFRGGAAQTVSPPACWEGGTPLLPPPTNTHPFSGLGIQQPAVSEFHKRVLIVFLKRGEICPCTPFQLIKLSIVQVCVWFCTLRQRPHSAPPPWLTFPPPRPSRINDIIIHTA